MNAVAWLNGAALVLALSASTAIGVMSDRSADEPTPSGPGERGAPSTLRDHAGSVVALGNFRRIVAASTVADQLLVELCEPDRVVAHTGYGARNSSSGYRYAGTPLIESIEELEAIVALHPDLVLLNDYGDPRRVTQLRRAGLTVFDLGPMRGMESLVTNIHDVATLIGHPERGDRLAASLTRRMAAVAVDVPPSRRVAGMYLSIYGGHLYGGARGTSYHDVLESAGLVDAAASYRDWPEYSSEEVLALDPPVVVGSVGARQKLCRHTGFERLRACRDGRIIEIEDALLGDPGLPMLEAAEAIRSVAYPEASREADRNP